MMEPYPLLQDRWASMEMSENENGDGQDFMYVANIIHRHLGIPVREIRVMYRLEEE